jgi:hypothetical protein
MWCQAQVVQAQNDFLALGARRALEEQPSKSGQDHKSRVSFLGVDGLPKTGQAWVRQGTLEATIIVPQPLRTPSMPWSLPFMAGCISRNEPWCLRSRFLRRRYWRPSRQASRKQLTNSRAEGEAGR